MAKKKGHQSRHPKNQYKDGGGNKHSIPEDLSSVVQKKNLQVDIETSSDNMTKIKKHTTEVVKYLLSEDALEDKEKLDKLFENTKGDISEEFADVAEKSIDETVVTESDEIRSEVEAVAKDAKKKIEKVKKQPKQIFSSKKLKKGISFTPEPQSVPLDGTYDPERVFGGVGSKSKKEKSVNVNVVEEVDGKEEFSEDIIKAIQEIKKLKKELTEAVISGYVSKEQEGQYIVYLRKDLEELTTSDEDDRYDFFIKKISLYRDQLDMFDYEGSKNENKESESEKPKKDYKKELREKTADVLKDDKDQAREDLDKLINEKLDGFFDKVFKSEIIDADDIIGAFRQEFDKVLPKELLETLGGSKEDYDNLREKYFNSFLDQFRLALKMNQRRNEKGIIGKELDTAKNIALGAGKFALISGVATRVATMVVGPLGSGGRALLRGVTSAYMGFKNYGKQEEIRKEQENKSLKELIGNVDQEKWLEVNGYIANGMKSLIDYDLNKGEQLTNQDSLVNSLEESENKIKVGEGIEARELSEKELLHKLFDITNQSLTEKDKIKLEELSKKRHELLQKAIESKTLDKFINVMLEKQIEKLKQDIDFDFDNLEESEKNMIMQQLHLSVERDLNTILSDIVAQDKIGNPDKSKGAFSKFFQSKILGNLPAESRIQAVLNGFISGVVTGFVSSDAAAGTIYATSKAALGTFSRETKQVAQKEIVKTSHEVSTNLEKLLQEKASISDIKDAILEARARIKLPDTKEADRAMLEIMIEKSQNYMIMYGELEMSMADNNNEAEGLTDRIIDILDKQTTKAQELSEKAAELETFVGQFTSFIKLSREDKKKIIKKVGASAIRGMVYGAVGAGLANLAMDTVELADSEVHDYFTDSSDDVSFVDKVTSMAGNQAMATLDRAGGFGAISALVELAIPDDELTSEQEIAIEIQNTERELNAEVNEADFLWGEGADADDLIEKTQSYVNALGYSEEVSNEIASEMREFAMVNGELDSIKALEFLEKNGYIEYGNFVTGDAKESLLLSLHNKYTETASNEQSTPISEDVESKDIENKDVIGDATRGGDVDKNDNPVSMKELLDINSDGIAVPSEWQELGNPYIQLGKELGIDLSQDLSSEDIAKLQETATQIPTQNAVIAAEMLDALEYQNKTYHAEKLGIDLSDGLDQKEFDKLYKAFFEKDHNAMELANFLRHDSEMSKVLDDFIKEKESVPISEDVESKDVIGDATRGGDVDKNTKQMEEEKQPMRFTDEILTEPGSKSHDSLWKSARTIIEAHPEDFGFKGEVSDEKAVYNFAERMTANLVAEIDDVKDLVHNQDVAVIEKGDDGKWHLSLEEKSGIEAGYLSDENVYGSDMLKAPNGYELADDMEFEKIESETGDVGARIELADGRIIEVWDWDRDGNPDIMENGKHNELSQTEFEKYLIEQGVFEKHEVATLETIPVNEVNEQAEKVLEGQGFKGIDVKSATIDSQSGDIINFIGEYKGIGIDYNEGDEMGMVELDRLHQEAENVKEFLESQHDFGLNFDKMYITSSGYIKGAVMDLPGHDNVISFEFAGDSPKISSVNISEQAEQAGMSKELINLARKLNGTEMDSDANANVLESLAKEYARQSTISKVVANLEAQGDNELLQQYLETKSGASLYLEKNNVKTEESVDNENSGNIDKQDTEEKVEEQDKVNKEVNVEQPIENKLKDEVNNIDKKADDIFANEKLDTDDVESKQSSIKLDGESVIKANAMSSDIYDKWNDGGFSNKEDFLSAVKEKLGHLDDTEQQRWSQVWDKNNDIIENGPVNQNIMVKSTLDLMFAREVGEDLVDKDENIETEIKEDIVEQISPELLAKYEVSYNNLKNIMEHRLDVLAKIDKGEISFKDIMKDLPNALADSGRADSIKLFKDESDVKNAFEILANSIKRVIPMPSSSFEDVNFKDGLSDAERKTIALFAQAIQRYDDALESGNKSARAILDYIDSSRNTN